MPADLLLYALIAAGLIFWLKHILGTRDDDNEMDKPKFSSEDEHPMMQALKPKEDNNVVALNNNVGGFILPRHVRIDNKTTENNLEEIQKQYSDFNLTHFVQGAEGAFSMIVESFAKGDIETLEGLLAEDVFAAFKNVIDDRAQRGETIETTIKAVEKIDITEAGIKDAMVFITVRISARETCVIRDKENNIIAGNPEDTTKMVDIWVFGRDMQSEGPEWHLYETRDDEVEDHKTPMPEVGNEKSKKQTKTKKSSKKSATSKNKND